MQAVALPVSLGGGACGVVSAGQPAFRDWRRVRGRRPLRPYALRRLAPLLAFLPLLLLGGCGGGEEAPASTQNFPPLRYDYLTPIRLNVASLEVQDRSAPAGSRDVAQLAPEPPVQALTQMARDRISPAGASGTAVFVIDRASILRDPNGTLDGTLAVHLDIINPQGVRAGFAEARVARQMTDPGGDQPPRAVLYALTKQMMDDMNVEFEYQVRHSLLAWLLPDTANPVPVVAQPLGPPGTPTSPSPPAGAPDAAAPTPLSPPAAPSPNGSAAPATAPAAPAANAPSEASGAAAPANPAPPYPSVGAYPPGGYPSGGYPPGGYPSGGYPPPSGYTPPNYAVPSASAPPYGGYTPPNYAIPGYAPSAPGYPPTALGSPTNSAPGVTPPGSGYAPPGMAAPATLAPPPAAYPDAAAPQAGAGTPPLQMSPPPGYLQPPPGSTPTPLAPMQY